MQICIKCKIGKDNTKVRQLIHDLKSSRFNSQIKFQISSGDLKSIELDRIWKEAETQS